MSKSFGSCIVGGRTTSHDMKTGLTSMQESQRHTVPAFLQECFVLQHLTLMLEDWIAFTTI